MGGRRPVVEAMPRYFSAQILSARRFHLRWPRQAGKSVMVLSGGVERCRPDYVIERPGFPHPILEFVAGGAGRLVMNGAIHDLVPGTVFSYGRGLSHRISCDPAAPMVKYFVVFAGAGARAQLRAHGLSPGAVLRVAQPDCVRRIFDDLIDFALGDRVDRETCCVQTAQYLILKIADLVVPAGLRAARAFTTYERCREYIERRGMEVSEIRQVARACHVDEAYLCRLFQRFGRERPSHYLQHLRMNHAAEQLQTTDRLVKDVAADLGFSDPANFTRAFRQWFGVPPRALRLGGEAMVKEAS